MRGEQRRAQILERFHEHLPELASAARLVARQLAPGVPLDDLLSWGAEGLLQAAERYQPERGVPFALYARRRVHGAMVDGLRAEAELPRRLHRARLALEGGGEQAGDGRALDLVSRHAVGMHAAELRGLVAAAGLGEEGEPIATSREPDPEQAVLDAELRRHVERAVKQLPGEQAEIVRRHVLGDELLEGVAEALGISVAWARELKQRAVRRLTPALRELAHDG